jgi:hypothetical protein
LSTASHEFAHFHGERHIDGAVHRGGEKRNVELQRTNGKRNIRIFGVDSGYAWREREFIQSVSAARNCDFRQLSVP